jgi:hypothetical protein
LWLALVSWRIASLIALWPPLLWLSASGRWVATVRRVRLVAPARLVALLIGSTSVPALPLRISIAAGIGLATLLATLLPLWALRLLWRAKRIVLTIGWIWRSAGAIRRLLLLL